MHSTNKLIFFLLVMVSAFTAIAETIAFWHFDEGISGNTATNLSSEYNATNMEGTAESNAGGPVPCFSDDIGQSYLRDKFAGTAIHTNKCSLKFTNTGLSGNFYSSEGGVVLIPHDDIMVISNMTVEVFVKIDRLVGYPLIIGKSRPIGTSWNIDMDDTGIARLRIDSYPVGVTPIVSTPGFNQVKKSSVNLNDQRWHHIALTYTHKTKEARLYIDYTLAASLTTENHLVYENLDLRIGQGCAGQAFDGWIDEVRISSEVLPISEFMIASSDSVDNDCYLYLGFDDGAVGAEANILTNSAYTGVFSHILSGSAGSTGTGSKPQFTNYLPSSTCMIVRDGVSGEVVNSNSTSLYFRNAGISEINPYSGSGGIVKVSDPWITGAFPTNFTAEAFIRIDRPASYATIMGKIRSDGGGEYSWWMQMNDAAGSGKNLVCRFDTTDPDNPATVSKIPYTISDIDLDDGQWHHLAMSYELPTKTAKIYVDYKLKLTQVTVYPMYLDEGEILIGGSNLSFDGWIDEVRISRVVLEPSEFLYLEKPPAPPGTIIIIQ